MGPNLSGIPLLSRILGRVLTYSLFQIGFARTLKLSSKGMRGRGRKCSPFFLWWLCKWRNKEIFPYKITNVERKWKSDLVRTKLREALAIF